MSLTFQPCLPPQTQLPPELPQGLLRDKIGLRQKANLYVITAQLGVLQGLWQRASASEAGLLHLRPRSQRVHKTEPMKLLSCAPSRILTLHTKR